MSQREEMRFALGRLTKRVGWTDLGEATFPGIDAERTQRRADVDTRKDIVAPQQVLDICKPISDQRREVALVDVDQHRRTRSAGRERPARSTRADTTILLGTGGPKDESEPRHIRGGARSQPA